MGMVEWRKEGSGEGYKMNPRRKIVKKETAHGYKGYPHLYITMECGHTREVGGKGFAWEYKSKSALCFECGKKREV